MSGTRFHQMCVDLAKQIHPEIDGDQLIEMSNRIHIYLSQNGSQNLVSLNLMSTNVFAFTETLSLNGKPLVLRQYQNDLLSSWQAGDESLVVHARGLGISLMLAIYTLWLACFGENVRIGYVSTSATRQTEAIRLIVGLYESSNFELPPLTQNNRRSLQFENGNRITFMQPTTYGHGMSLSNLIVEDASSISLNNDDNIYSLFLLTSGQVIITGCPNVNVGIFHELATSPIWFPNGKTYLPYSVNPEYDADWADGMRGILGNKAFENQYNLAYNNLILE